MSRKRIINFVNVTNPDKVASCIAFKKGCAEFNYILALQAQKSKNKTYIFIQYIYCESQHCFIKLTGIDDTIIVEQDNTTIEEFDRLYEHYQQYFIAFNTFTYQSYQSGELNLFKQAWENIFRFFITPLNFLNGREHTNVLISFLPEHKNKYLLDLSTVFDLQFRFYPVLQNISSYVLSVTGTDIVTFTENILDLFYPTAAKTIILNGFDEYYTESAIVDAQPDVKKMALGRKELYSQMFNNARQAGAQVIALNNQEVFFTYLKKGWEGHLLQLLTHYEIKNEIDRRLSLQKKSLRMDIMERIIHQIRINNTLRDDIIIDAVTCTNFFDFKNLYSQGFKYLYLSHHDIDTDLASFALNELFTGINAKRLNWPTNYLDGNHHLHEARSNVMRCFFTICNGGNFIYTP
jgi:hypothetical protein